MNRTPPTEESCDPSRIHLTADDNDVLSLVPPGAPAPGDHHDHVNGVVILQEEARQQHKDDDHDDHDDHHHLGSTNFYDPNHAFADDEQQQGRGGGISHSSSSFLPHPPPFVAVATQPQEQVEELLGSSSLAHSSTSNSSSQHPIAPSAAVPHAATTLEHHHYYYGGGGGDHRQHCNNATTPVETTAESEARGTNDNSWTGPIETILTTAKIGAETTKNHIDADGGTTHAHMESHDHQHRHTQVISNSNTSKANTERWTAMYQRLQAYKERFGHCLVPKRYPDDPQLGTFVETQRVQYKRLKRTVDDVTGNEVVIPNNRMTIERLSLLESIGFAWSAKTPKKIKDASTESRTVVEDQDHTPQPKRRRRASPEGMVPPPPESLTVDSLLAVQGTNGVESASQITRNPIRQQQQMHDDEHWNDMYQKLVSYRAQHGHCLVPRKYPDDPKLARWVEIQRGLWNRDYRNSNGGVGGGGGASTNGDASATAPATAAAAAVASTSTETVQMEPVAAATPSAMHDSHATDVPTELGNGHDHPPVEWDDTYFPSHIVDTTEAIHMVDTIPSTLDEDDPGAVEAAENTETTATAWQASTLDASEDNKVATELDDQSSKLDDHSSKLSHEDTLPTKRLSQERKNKLDALGFVWNLRSKRIEDHWDEMFQQLCDYKLLHGDCRVPSRYEPNPRLGKWVETQRYEYTKMQRAAHGGLGNAGTTDFRAEAPAHPAESPVFPTKRRGVSARLTEDRIQRLEGIGFEWKIKNKMKRYYDKQWDQMFERLLQYTQVHGHCLVPKRYPADPRLGTWCHTQRIQFKKSLHSATGNRQSSSDGLSDPESEELPDKAYDEPSFRLTDERRKRLEEIGFCWSAREKLKAEEPAKVARNSYDDRWDEMFNRLVAYKERYGDCLVPKRYKEDPKLGTWTDTQRSMYKRMKKKLAEEGIAHRGPSLQRDDDKVLGTCVGPKLEKPIIGRLTEERIQRLQGIGFVWSLRDDWQQHYEELKQFKMEHGHVNVPARYEKNKKLGLWVSAQRQQCKLLQAANGTTVEPRRSGSLTKERIEMLTELGFTWSIRSRTTLGEHWNQKLNELRTFRSMYGHCNVPARYPDNPELGIWVGTQRTQYRLYMKAKEAGEDTIWQSSMTEDRIRLLENLGFVWSIRGDGRREYHDERDGTAPMSFDLDSTISKNGFVGELTQHEPFDALRRESV